MSLKTKRLDVLRAWGITGLNGNCYGKRQHESEKLATQSLRKMKQLGKGIGQEVYKCGSCEFWHCGHPKAVANV